MNDHIAKPIDPNKLFLALNKWIKLKARPVLQSASFPPQGEHQAENFPVLPGIDTASGLFHAGGSASLLHNVLVKFGESNFAAEIQQSLAKGEMDQARRLAHTLKGAAGTIGALRLHTLAAELESNLVFTPDFEAELNLVLDSIRSLPSAKMAANVVTPKAIDPVALLQTLQNLKPHVEKKRPKNCEPILEELAQMGCPAAMQSDIANLARLIKTYKLKEASHILESMIRHIQNIV